MTQTKLGKKLGLSPGETSRMVRGERGTRVQFSMVARVARALDVDLAWLGDGSGPAPRQGDKPADRLKHRSEAARICEEGGIDRSTIDRALTEDFGEEAEIMSTLQWIEIMLLASKMPPRKPHTTPPPSPEQESRVRPRADILPPTRRSSPQKK